MKKLLLAFSLLVAGCYTTSQLTPTPSVREVYVPWLEAFELSDACPNICWLGLRPGMTTLEQATQVVTTSDQFDQNFTEILDKSIKAYWYPENTKTFGTEVYITFSENVIESITLARLTPFTVQDFIGLLGQPGEMSLIVQKGLHDDTSVIYNLYYSQFKAAFQIRSRGEYGPKPDDFVERVTINIEIQDSYRQPWLGYGNLDEYLLRAIPTPTILGPP